MAGSKADRERKEAKLRRKRAELAEYYEATYTSDREPAKSEVHGIAAVTRLLQGIDFPADKRSLLGRLEGRRQFDWVKGRNMDLVPILEQLPQERFASVTDLTRAVSEFLSETAEA